MIDGTALAVIQALYAKLREKDKEIAELWAELRGSGFAVPGSGLISDDAVAKEKRISELEARLERLEKMVTKAAE